jgi:hypothetical protein
MVVLFEEASRVLEVLVLDPAIEDLTTHDKQAEAALDLFALHGDTC